MILRLMISMESHCGIFDSRHVKGGGALFLGGIKFNALNVYVPCIISLPPSSEIPVDHDVIKYCLS